MIPFCCGTTASPPSDPLHGSGYKYLVRGKIWKSKQVLSVYFLNKEFIDEHGGSSVLTVQNIMDWAGVWNSCVPVGNTIPKFKMVLFQNGKADIRIKFSSENHMHNSLDVWRILVLHTV